MTGVSGSVRGTPYQDRPARPDDRQTEGVGMLPATLFLGIALGALLLAGLCVLTGGILLLLRGRR